MTDLTRRRFILSAGTLATAGVALRRADGFPFFDESPTAATSVPMDTAGRRDAAYRLRVAAAAEQRDRPAPTFPINGDEDRYPDHIASFSKCLLHDDLGHVDPASYDAFLRAVHGGRFEDVDSLVLGGRMKLANPLAAHAFDLEGADPHQLAMPAPPAFASAEMASEMVELYWQALTRDVPFARYEDDTLIAAASADLSRCAEFRGPRSEGAVTPATVFRGTAAGALVGPWLSQFLWLNVPQGIHTLEQRGRVTVPGDDHVSTLPEWLAIQRGAMPSRIVAYDPTPRFMRNARDLGEYVHRDYTYQAYLNAALILLGMGVRQKSEYPYRYSKTQGGFITFGQSQVLDTVARVGNAALKACWCQKWLVHNRLRPEAFAGRIHNHVTRRASYPLHDDVLDSDGLARVRRATGAALLPLAYPEGSPTHPSYPAGHSVIAGACVTVLKAFFDEQHAIPNPVVAGPEGTTLEAWQGAPLRVGAELDKLASNVSIARNAAGVHFRSDSLLGLTLGESVAIEVLRELRTTVPEPFPAFAFTRFSGEAVRV